MINFSGIIVANCIRCVVLVGTVRRREIPALLALVGDGVGRRDHVKLAVIDQRAARLGRYIGKLDKLLGTGLLVAHAKDGSGDLVAGNQGQIPPGSSPRHHCLRELTVLCSRELTGVEENFQKGADSGRPCGNAK